MMKKILVTGGCGFIGSNFIRSLLRLQDNIFVINIDKLTYAGDVRNLSDINGLNSYAFIQQDICYDDAMQAIFKQGIDYVINFAAESHVDRSIEDSQVFIKSNILGTQVLLNNSLKYGVKKYIQISTDEVYGSLSLDGTGAFAEDTPLSPRNPYSATKASADMLVKSYYHTYGLPVMITRCSNNYGEFQHPEKLIPKTIVNAIREQPIGIYGDGLNVRDWIYVQDHCSAIQRVLEKGTAGEVYNIGANYEISNIDIVKHILKHLGKTEDLIKFTKDRPGHDRRYAMNSGKIQRELGWTPKTDFQTGIANTIEWYMRNKDWWKSVQQR